MKILVFEDEPVVQTYLTAILPRAGFEGEVEANEDEALRRCCARRPHASAMGLAWPYALRRWVRPAGPETA